MLVAVVLASLDSLLCVACWSLHVPMENPCKRARTKSEREDEDAIPKVRPCVLCLMRARSLVCITML